MQLKLKYIGISFLLLLSLIFLINTCTAKDTADIIFEDDTGIDIKYTESSIIFTALDNEKVKKTQNVKIHESIFEKLIGFDGGSVGYTHIADDGTVTNREIDITKIKDKDGYIQFEMEFSTVIISGFTGYTSYSGSATDNLTINFSDTLDVIVANVSINVTSIGKYKNITFTNPPTIDDYQIRLNVTYDSDMQNDFDDLRFYNSSGYELSYWIQEYTESISATVWVKIPNQESNILMFYGNTNAEDMSDGENVFEIFSDGESTTGWSSLNGGSVSSVSSPSISGNALRVVGADLVNYAGVYCSLGMNAYVVEYDIRIGNNEQFYVDGYYGDISNRNMITCGINNKDISDSVAYFDGSWHSEYAYTYDNWVNIKLVVKSLTNYDIYVNGTLEKTDAAVRGTITTYENLALHTFAEQGIGYIDNLFVRKYLATEPTANFGSEQSNSLYLTAAVAGDSYLFIANGSTSLVPTDEINNITFTTNVSSIGYAYNVTLYWQENVTLFHEALNGLEWTASIDHTNKENTINGTITYTPVYTNIQDMEMVTTNANASFDYSGGVITVYTGQLSAGDHNIYLFGGTIPGYTIYLHALDSVSGATINTFAGYLGNSYLTTTNGTIVFTDTPSGTYNIAASATGYNDNVVRQAITGNTVVNINLVESGGGGGTIVYQDSGFVVGLSVGLLLILIYRRRL